LGNEYKSLNIVVCSEFIDQMYKNGIQNSLNLSDPDNSEVIIQNFNCYSDSSQIKTFLFSDNISTEIIQEHLIEKINEEGEEYINYDFGYDIIHIQDKHVSAHIDLLVLYNKLFKQKDLFARSTSHRIFHTNKGRIIDPEELIYFSIDKG